jgi:hypothetical protein
MGSLPFPQNKPKQLEQYLLDEMQAKWVAYLAASEEHANIEDEFSNVLDYPDGAHAMHEAAKKEQVALENYTRAVRAFNDFTVRSRHPIPPGDPKS